MPVPLVAAAGGMERKGSPSGLLGAKDDTPLAQVIGGQLHGNFIAAQNANVVLAHFPGNMSHHFVPVFQPYLECGIGHGIDNRAFHFDMFFFRHAGLKPL